MPQSEISCMILPPTDLEITYSEKIPQGDGTGTSTSRVCRYRTIPPATGCLRSSHKLMKWPSIYSINNVIFKVFPTSSGHASGIGLFKKIG